MNVYFPFISICIYLGLPWWLSSKDLLAMQEVQVQFLGQRDPWQAACSPWGCKSCFNRMGEQNTSLANFAFKIIVKTDWN